MALLIKLPPSPPPGRPLHPKPEPSRWKIRLHDTSGLPPQVLTGPGDPEHLKSDGVKVYSPLYGCTHQQMAYARSADHR